MGPQRNGKFRLTISRLALPEVMVRLRRYGIQLLSQTTTKPDIGYTDICAKYESPNVNYLVNQHNDVKNQFDKKCCNYMEKNIIGRPRKII